LEEVFEIISKKDQINNDQQKETEVIRSRIYSEEKNQSSKEIFQKNEEKEKLKKEKGRTNNKILAIFDKACELISTFAERKESTVLLKLK